MASPKKRTREALNEPILVQNGFPRVSLTRPYPDPQFAVAVSEASAPWLVTLKQLQGVLREATDLATGYLLVQKALQRLVWVKPEDETLIYKSKTPDEQWISFTEDIFAPVCLLTNSDGDVTSASVDMDSVKTYLSRIGAANDSFMEWFAANASRDYTVEDSEDNRGLNGTAWVTSKVGMIWDMDEEMYTWAQVVTFDPTWTPSDLGVTVDIQGPYTIVYDDAMKSEGKPGIEGETALERTCRAVTSFFGTHKCLPNHAANSIRRNACVIAAQLLSAEDDVTFWVVRRV